MGAQSVIDQSNAINNAVPLPVADALDVVNTPALVQSPADVYYGNQQGSPDVGDALDVVDDPVASRVAAGGSIHIATQAEWDALPLAQKEMLRAVKAAGGEVKAADALRTYQAAARAADAKRVTAVDLPDGRRAALVGNNIVLPEKNTPVQMERVVDESGVVRMVDPTSGRSFPAWDAATGEPVRVAPKMSEAQRLEMQRAQKMLDGASSRVQALADFPDDAVVAWDDNSGAYRRIEGANRLNPFNGGISAGTERTRLLTSVKKYEGEVSRIGGGVKPESGERKPDTVAKPAGGYAAAADVARDFQAGKIDRATAKKILLEKFNIQ